ncbi:DUF3150 domain-containing protein [uncultured Thiocystis sp.]|uniref:DUF3150 domain-containing protein n=1 Tax=uncultured Thiocystis sp. TaxID=1202134 RepID=UPI0025F7DC12|nr:DUF3150 domain-containing protein [uncultured Thiocystis sp.]
MNDTLITIAEKMALIVLTVSQWSGRKKLRADDLELTDSEVPSEELVSLGSKRICNPDALRVFGTLKGQADRACLKVGTRFLGGYLIPNDQLAALSGELDLLKTEYEVETQHFLTGYDREIEDWILRHPEWERQLRTAVDPAAKIGTKFSFRYRPLIIQPAEGQHDTLVEDVADIATTVFHEIAQIAIPLEKSLIGKEAMSQHALRTFRRVQQKLDILSFVDPRIGPILDQVERFLRQVPPSGPVTGSMFQEGFGLWMLLCDEDRMARHGAGMLNPVVEAEVDAEVDADAEVEAETEVESDVETMTEVEAEADIATHLDVSLDASDLFDDFDDFDVETPFLGVFEEARLNDAEAEVAEAETKTIQDFGWF